MIAELTQALIGSWVSLHFAKKIYTRGVKSCPMIVMKSILSPELVEKMGLYLGRVHPRFALLWKIGTCSGLRIGDLLSLQPRHFNIPETCSRISLREKKTGKTRIIGIGGFKADVSAFVARYMLRPEDYLFWGRNHWQSMSRQWAHRIIALTAQNLGLDHIGPHSMRKIYACNLFASLGSLKCVQRDFRHKDISTSEIYVKDLLERGVILDKAKDE